MDTSITSSYVRAKSSSVKSRPAEDRALIQTKKNKHASVHEEDENTKQNPSKRRKTTDAIPKRMKQLGQLTMDADAALGIGASSTAKTKRRDTLMVQEKRLRMWRKAPSQRFLEKLDRALTQRMFVIGRKRGGTDEQPEETFTMVGTIGNVYEVTVGKLPNCTCPDGLNGNHCKHLIYVMAKVLKAREELQYQVALLSSELQELFENAPPSPIDIAKTDDELGKRKPVDGDCPICFSSFDPDENEIVWCRAACGNNIHKTCFEQWAASTRSRGVTCVYCRTPWQSGSGNELISSGNVNSDGYVNVAAEYGLSGQRDYSTYHPFWVEQQMRRRGREGP